MGFFSLFLIISVLVISIMWTKLGNTEMVYNDWWGPEYLKGYNDTSIRPFKVEFTKQMIADLRFRLKNHRPFVPPLEGVGFEYGFNSAQMDGWLQYWAEEYPFWQREQFLNQFPQYKTNIQGLDIHFIRVRPEVPPGIDVVPMLILHGWPGSVREFYEAIPLLTAVSHHRDFALEVIIPHLPGFGFSDAAVRPGLASNEIAVVFRNLMHRLGHKKFYIQGGDWGSIVCRSIATLFPEEVLGYHTNFALSFKPKSFLYWILGSIYPPWVVDPSLADRMYPITKVVKMLMQESGYFHIQSAKPDTIGIALTDTPSGLLAYIFQLFSVGTRSAYVYSFDGGLDNHYGRAQLIDNLMIYWMTNSITTSVRIYGEMMSTRSLLSAINEPPTPVPTWTMHAKDEIFYQSPFLLKFKYPNLVNSTVLDYGGHFLALELPEIFTEDVLKAVTTFRRLQKKNKLFRI